MKEINDTDKLLNKWISVKDKLPSDNVNVLVYGKHYKYRIAQVDFYSEKVKAWYKQDGGFIGAVNSENITYWMPLPAPPSL